MDESVGMDQGNSGYLFYSQKFRNLLRKSLIKCNNGESKRDIIKNKCL